MGLGEWFGLGKEDAAKATPDWTSSVYWLAHPRHHPDRVRSALPTASVTVVSGRDEEPQPSPIAPEAWSSDCQATAPGDVFFLHGTMEMWGNRASINRYESEEWNQFNTRHQMTMILAFTGSCSAYAPLYRQAAFRGDWDLAYQDVLAAFEHFLQEVPEARPLILAGHSQGSIHLARLVRERVATDEKVLARVAGIHAPGMARWLDPSPLPLESGDEGGQENSCSEGGATVAVWATVAPETELRKTLVGMMAKGEPPSAFANPGSWADEEGKTDLGMLLPGPSDEPRLFFGLLGRSEVSGSLLRLHAAAGAEAALEAALKIHPGSRDYHAWDVHLFWGNVRRRVSQQVQAHRFQLAKVPACGENGGSSASSGVPPTTPCTD